MTKHAQMIIDARPKTSAAQDAGGKGKGKGKRKRTVRPTLSWALLRPGLVTLQGCPTCACARSSVAA